MKNLKTVLFKNIFIVFFVIGFLFPINSAFSSPVQDQLKNTIDNILQILRDPSFKGEEKKEQKRALLSKTIHEKFSFAKMSQLSLARHWRKRSDQEKKEFIEIFGQLLEETYISKIESYTDEKIIYIKEFVKKKRAIIYTKIVTNTIEVPIDYRMYQTKKDNWMVYDIVIEGVSLVGNYRSQFDQILQKNSYEKLIEDLKKKLGLCNSLSGTK